MTEQEGGYRFQLSIKHGPMRGNTPVGLTNIRSNSWGEFVNDLAEVADVAPAVEAAVAALTANDVIHAAFPETETVEQSDPGWPLQNCVHNVRRKLIQGNRKSDGKAYKMQVCQVENDPNLPKCDPIFPPR